MEGALAAKELEGRLSVFTLHDGGGTSEFASDMIPVQGGNATVNEAEWLACTDPVTMLESIPGTVSDRT